MFRFTIRDLLWLTALAAMGVGWWVDIRRLNSSMAATELRAANEHFKEVEALKKTNRELSRKNDDLLSRERIREWNWRFQKYDSKLPYIHFDE